MKGDIEIPYHHQLGPNGRQGQPYVITKYDIAYPHASRESTTVVRSYQTQQSRADVRYKQSSTSRAGYGAPGFKINWSYLQKKRLIEQLNKCFPFVYLITHVLCVIANSLIQIGIQIALMATNGALWWVAAGIWAGVYFIIMAVLTLLLIKVRNYWLFIITYVLHVFGILVAIGAYLIVNVIAISENTLFCSYYPNCFNSDVKDLNYTQFLLGVVLIVILLIYCVLMPFWIMDIPNEYRLYQESKRVQKDDLYNYIADKNATLRNDLEDTRAPNEIRHAQMYAQIEVDYDGSFRNFNHR